MKKSIIITGVAGLVGSRMADWLIENKPEYDIIGIDNLFGGYIENVNKNVVFYNRDLSKDSISDIFVMSSVSEPFGLTALEAAHHGNALVITKQSGVGEVLNSIVRYDFWDEDKLAGALVNIAESPALVTTLRDGIKREYGRISWDDVAEKCVQVYDEVNKHKRNRF